MRAAALIAVLGLLWPATVDAQDRQRESPREMRRIIAEAVCLSEGYPGTAIAADAVAIVSVYQGALGGRVTTKDVESVRGLARESQPAAPTPVGKRNLAIARCVLFANRADVLKLLGDGRGRRRR